MNGQTMTSEVREALGRIVEDYLAMPGLRLTLWQAGRLWSLPVDLCEHVLEALVMQGFLTETADGLYVRRGRNGLYVAAPTRVA